MTTWCFTTEGVATVPLQVKHALTQLEQSLAVLVRALCAWAGEHLDEIENNQVRYDQDKEARPD